MLLDYGLWLALRGHPLDACACMKACRPLVGESSFVVGERLWILAVIEERGACLSGTLWMPKWLFYLNRGPLLIEPMEINFD